MAWQVPVCLQYPVGPSQATVCSLLRDPKQTIDLANARSCPEWVNADAGAAGYYRVFYEGGLGNKLTGAAQVLSEAERVNLVRNTKTLFDAGLIGPTEALEVAARFGSAVEAPVVFAVTDILGSARELLTPETRPLFAALLHTTHSHKGSRL